MDDEYEKIGWKITRFIDSAFLYGTSELFLSFLDSAKSKLKMRRPPLDWDGNTWQDYYYNEKSLLWITGKNNERLYLPQSVILAPWEAKGLHNKIKVKLHEPDFEPRDKNEQCLNFYIKDGDFPGKNARLLNYDKDKHELTFQGAVYFDWIMTNLSLDFVRSPLPTLREETSLDGKLQDLHSSQLTNITGINGLLFSNDGYMIYQKRNEEVLVRPNQLCSGFSGTVDKVDIEHLIQSTNPVLSNMYSVREAVEEVGIDRKNVKQIVFLGITRELIRGGTPELFYSADLDLNRNQILKLIPQEKEGIVKSVSFGMYATSLSDGTMAERTLWGLINSIEEETSAPLSIPFITNLALWYWHWANDKVGVGGLE